MLATVVAGDYAIHGPDGTIIAAVERKSLENLAGTLSDGTLAFQMQPPDETLLLDRTALPKKGNYPLLHLARSEGSDRDSSGAHRGTPHHSLPC